MPKSREPSLDIEQLELPERAERLPVRRDICEQIATFVCHSCTWSTAELTSLHTTIVNDCSSQSSSSHGSGSTDGWFSTLATTCSNATVEYLNGASTALNPLPPSTVHFGNWHTDRTA